MRVLIVEDDAALARGLMTALHAAGHAADHVQDGDEAVDVSGEEPYSLMVLDLGLPGLAGLDVLRRIRQRGDTLPIMILTARAEMGNRILGLDLGADDFMSKPFALQEFEARVRALIRRGQGQPNPILTCGGLVLDRSSGSVTLWGRAVPLRRRELMVLTALIVRAGKVVLKERLAAEVFGFDDSVAPNTLELYVARLRKRLVPDGPAIRTVRGLGYMLEKP